MAAGGKLDLKTWTRDQLYAEMLRTYDEIWQARQELGGVRIDALGGYVDKNTFPASIRGTVRDAVSYFAVALLGNTSYWRADESNDLFRLDFDKLLAGGATATPRLDATATHPLERIGGGARRSGKLARARNGQRDAALEARMARITALHAAFSDERHRTALRLALEARLADARATSWWSMGMARLAQLYIEADDSVRAHQLASDGEKAYPETPGGHACRALRQEIEAPRLELTTMATDGPRQRSLELKTRNVTRVYFRAYARDLDEALRSASTNRLQPKGAELQLLLASHALVEWSESLPPSSDYRTHRTFITPPLDKLGLYYVVASLEPTFSSGHGSNAPPVDEPYLVGCPLILTNLMLAVRRQEEGGAEVTILDGKSGHPVAGATVEVLRYNWSQRQHTSVAQLVTDGKGVATLAASLGQGYSTFLLARKGGDLTTSGSVYLGASSPPRSYQSALLFTDRSIYRPQQRVQWKVLAYEAARAGSPPTPLRRRAVTVILSDANGQTVEQRDVTTNEYGTAAGAFTIPAGRLLGNWSLRALGGATAVRVEEYKRPTFEVSFRDPSTEMRLNQPAQLVGEAKYYFGLPVTAGAVRWRVTRTPVYPFWWGWYGWAPAGIRSGHRHRRDDGRQRRHVYRGVHAVGRGGSSPKSAASPIATSWPPI